MGIIIEYNNKHTHTRTTVLGIESEGVSSNQSFHFLFFFSFLKKSKALKFFFCSCYTYFLPPSPANLKFKKKFLFRPSSLLKSKHIDCIGWNDGIHIYKEQIDERAGERANNKKPNK